MLKNGNNSAHLTATDQLETISSAALMKLGENIREERMRQGLSREDLAERANTSIDTIKRFESGKGTRLDIAFHIAEALHIPLQSLLPKKEPTLEQVLREILVLVLTAIKLLTKQ